MIMMPSGCFVFQLTAFNDQLLSLVEPWPVI